MVCIILPSLTPRCASHCRVSTYQVSVLIRSFTNAISLWSLKILIWKLYSQKLLKKPFLLQKIFFKTSLKVVTNTKKRKNKIFDALDSAVRLTWDWVMKKWRSKILWRCTFKAHDGLLSTLHMLTIVATHYPPDGSHHGDLSTGLHFLRATFSYCCTYFTSWPCCNAYIDIYKEYTTLSQRLSTFCDIIRNVAGKTWYYAEYFM